MKAVSSRMRSIQPPPLMVKTGFKLDDDDGDDDFSPLEKSIRVRARPPVVILLKGYIDSDWCRPVHHERRTQSFSHQMMDLIYHPVKTQCCFK